MLVGQPFAHLAAHGQHPFVAQLLGAVEQLGMVALEHDLGEAVAVAEVHEHLIVVGSVGVDPAVQDRRLPDVRLAQLAAGVCPPQSRHDVLNHSVAAVGLALAPVPVGSIGAGFANVPAGSLGPDLTSRIVIS